MEESQLSATGWLDNIVCGGFVDLVKLPGPQFPNLQNCDEDEDDGDDDYLLM